MKRTVFVFAILLSPVLLPSPAGSATIRLVYRFEKPSIEALESGFSRILFDDALQAGRPGEPSYPFHGAEILLPPGHAVSGASITRKDWTIIAGRHKLYPAQEPVPGAVLEERGRRFLCNASAYEIDRWVQPPDAAFKTRYLRGHAIATGAMSPLGYHPASGAVGWHRTIEVAVETAPSQEAREALALLRTGRETLDRLSRIVDNPDAIAEYAPLAAPLRDPDSGFEYLIVTGAQYAGDFAPLKDIHTRRGMRAAIMTVEEIAAAYGGIDTAERIRNCIKDKYINNGITHVLLAGDWDGAYGAPKIVPFRGLYGRVQSSRIYVDAGMPADLYFGSLDGTWNADGDSLWGEPGEDDPYAEVAVGRAPVDTPEEIAAFIAKTVMYREQPVAAEVRRALLLGEQLYNDPLTYGDEELELLVGTHDDNGFTTTGIPTDFAIVRKYDKVAVWTKDEAIGEINAGANWVAHAGHSNHNKVMRMSRSDVTDAVFTNDGLSSNFPILLSTGCYAGSFDNWSASGWYDPGDCIAEQMVLINRCAVAFVCNSRYGWFTEGTTNGPSIHFVREFFDAVFTEGYTALGAAHSRSKDETVPFLDLPDEWEPGAFRWCFYESNLLGDPALDGWTDTPRTLTATYAPQIDRNDTLFSVDAGVPGAVACLYWDGAWYARGAADALGRIAVVRSRALPDSVIRLELNITAPNRFVHRDTIDVVETAVAGRAAPALNLEQNYPNPFNPATVIRFSLPSDCDVELIVFDASGRLLDRLVRGRMAAGPHSVVWAPTGLPSGVYFYSLKYRGIALTRKALVLK